MYKLLIASIFALFCMGRVSSVQAQTPCGPITCATPLANDCPSDAFNGPVQTFVTVVDPVTQMQCLYEIWYCYRIASCYNPVNYDVSIECISTGCPLLNPPHTQPGFYDKVLSHIITENPWARNLADIPLCESGQKDYSYRVFAGACMKKVENAPHPNTEKVCSDTYCVGEYSTCWGRDAQGNLVIQVVLVYVITTNDNCEYLPEKGCHNNCFGQ